MRCLLFVNVQGQDGAFFESLGWVKSTQRSRDQGYTTSFFDVGEREMRRVCLFVESVCLLSENNETKG